MGLLQIYRGNVVVLEKRVDKADFNGQVMGENKINVDFTLFQSFKFRIGDYILHRSVKYSIWQAPTEKKTANRRYTYSIDFEAPEYGLYNTQFRHLNSGTFSFTGTADQMIDLIVQVSGSPWSRGDIEITEVLTGNFDKDSCRTAITKIAQLFSLEFRFNKDGSIDMLRNIGEVITGAIFRYGINNGLYDLTRQPISEDSFGTRFYGYGGSVNLPAGYRSGATELQFDGFYVDSPNVGDFDQIIERPANFPEIFPQRTSTITAQSATSNGWSVTDSSMDFDLNNTIVDGSAKIVFKTGALSGNEFEITGYNNSTKVISFNVNREDSGYVLPNTTVKPSVGDQYTFIGIVMPQSYIDSAEAQLKAATEQYAIDNSTPKISYALSFDELFMRNRGYETLLTFGDKIRVIDLQMDVDVILRIQQISYPIFNEGKISAVITDTATYTLAEKVIVDIDKIDTTIKEDQRTQNQRSIAASIRLRELQNYIFDPEGYFDGTHLKPNSIETLYLSVGAKATNFSLKQVGFNANVDGDPSVFAISAGQLVHFDLDIPGVGFTWNMISQEFTALDPLKSYYVYAKVSRTSLTGTWQLSTDIIKAEQQAGFFTLQVGVLFTEFEGRRDHEFTKGMTFIIGDQITAGVVKDLSGINFFNLTEGTFNLGTIGTGMDFGISLPDTLSVQKIVIGYGDYISGIGNDGNFPLFIGANSLSNPTSAKFRVQRDGTFYATGANISGVLNAGAGSTIGDILIDAQGKFNLVGTRVEIKPDEYVRVFNDGVVNFRDASKMVIPSKAVGLSSGESALWASNLSGISNNPSGYVLPVASASILGGVKIGAGLTMTGEVLSASGGESPLTFTFPLVRTINNVTIDPNSYVKPDGTNASGNWFINITGEAGSVKWGNVAGRPTNLSQFTNDLGNYGNWITKAQGDTYYTPINSETLQSVTARAASTSETIYFLAANAFRIQGLSGSPAYGVLDQTANSGGKIWRFGHTGMTDGFDSFDIGNVSNNIVGLSIRSNGNASIGYTSDQGQKFAVNGSIRSTTAEATGTQFLPIQAPSSLPSGKTAIWASNLSGISNNPSGYVLPIATTAILGGIIVGNGLTINPSTGRLDATGAESPLSFLSPLIRTGNTVSIDLATYAKTDGLNAFGNWPININGSATSVPWIGVTGKPTNLSQFTNDLGNYGNWITKSQGDGYYTPINSETLQSIATRGRSFDGELVVSKYKSYTGNMIFDSGGSGNNFNFLNGDLNIGYSLSQGYKLAINGSGMFNGAPGSDVLTLKKTGSNPSLNFIGSISNTIIEAGNDYRVYVNGQVRQAIFTNGNTGIGYNTDQQYKLAVNGSGFFATSIQSPIVKATVKLSVPTTSTTVDSGEAVLWIGNLSGITN